jgi:hypothetical protein
MTCFGRATSMRLLVQFHNNHQDNRVADESGPER